jgi:hypothetical protein
MNKIFDNDSYNAVNNRFGEGDRYQIIYPYESDKIYIKPDVNAGVYSCYRELMRSNIKDPLFMVHNLDTGTIYHLEIPKFKNLTHNKISNIHKPIINKPNAPLVTQVQTLQIPQPQIPQPVIIEEPREISRARINDLVTRLNNVEYQVEKLRKKIKKIPKKEEEICIIC